MIECICQAQEWARFRGIDGKGHGIGRSIPVAIDKKNYIWQLKLPGVGYSSPVLWDKKVFVTWSNVSEKKRGVICIDCETGKQDWIFSAAFETYRHHRDNSYAASTPALDERNIYLSWVSGTKLIVEAVSHDGKSVWKRNDLGSFSGRHGAGASPIVIGDIVIAGNDNRSKDSFLIGLDSKTGKTVWKHERKSHSTSYITPTVYRPQNKPAEIIFCSSPHGISSIDPISGKLNWETGGIFTLKSVASPVVAGGLIFATAGRGGAGVESAAIRPGQTVKTVYSLKADLPYVPTPIVVNSLMFILSDQGVVSCIEAETGKGVWKEKIGGKYYSSPVCVNNKIYCISQKGEMVVFEASKEYRLLARNQLPGKTFATPAIANDRLYIRSAGTLICIGPKTEAPLKKN